MKKLKLELDALNVESFVTHARVAHQGTVEAHATFRGNTCGAENTCGPQTCPPLYCAIETDNPCTTPCPVISVGCPPGSAGCPSAGCPVSGQLSCVGCTTFDYTANVADDTCGLCQSFGSDLPQRCPCI
jgi:hypothetical protein